MASSGKTGAIKLNQWAPTDPVLRDDFNEDNQKVDTAVNNLGVSMTEAVGGLTSRIDGIPNIKFEYGSYQGSGNLGSTVYLNFSPNFEPFVGFISTSTNNYFLNCGVMFKGCAVAVAAATSMISEVTFSTGQISFKDNAASNNYTTSGRIYNYGAIGVVR